MADPGSEINKTISTSIGGKIVLLFDDRLGTYGSNGLRQLSKITINRSMKRTQVIDRPQLKRDCHFLRDAAITFLKESSKDGAFPPSSGAFVNAMTTAEVVSMAGECHMPLEVLGCSRGFQYLLKSQRANGSWTDKNFKDPWDISSTAWAVHALRYCDLPEAKNARTRGIGWLVDSVLPTGGLPTNAGHNTPNTYATAYGLRGIQNEANLPKRKVAEFLLVSQNTDGGWGLKKGDPSESTLTAYVLHGLLDGKLDWASDTIQRGIDFLQRARTDDGIWGSWLSEKESVEGTAFCLYILRRYNVPINDLDIKGLTYIKSRISRGDAFKIEDVDQMWVAVSVILASNICSVF